MKKRTLLKALLLGGIVMTSLSGCGENRDSREWIEDQVSEVSRVYPTENLFDLFEEFPEGFEIRSSDFYEVDGETYNQSIHLTGDSEKKQIIGIYRNVKIETDPYKETIINELDVMYESQIGLKLINGENIDTILRHRDFLFQKLPINKQILKRLENTSYSYSTETNRYTISYDIENLKIDQFFSLKNSEKVKMSIDGMYDIGNYNYAVSIKKGEINYYETILERRGNNDTK